MAFGREDIKNEFQILFVRNDGVIYPTGMNFANPNHSVLSTELIKRNATLNYLSSQNQQNSSTYLTNSSRFHPYH